MPRQNTRSRYGSIAQAFHWLTALLIFAAFPIGYFAHDLSQQVLSPGFDGDPAVIARAAFLFSLHKTLGVAVFFTALGRILWALGQTKPAPLHPERRAETLLAETAHWMLYGALVLAPLSGWVHHAATEGFAPIWWPLGQGLPMVAKSAAVAETAASVHWLAVWTLAAAVALHVAGALKHVAVDRDGTLARMLPGKRPLHAPDAPHRAAAHAAAPLMAALAVWAAVLGGGAAFGLFSHPAAPQVAANLPENASASEAEGSAWAVTGGRLGITISQMGGTVEGEFSDWSADIRFDEPDAPGPAGSVRVTIPVPSLTLGSVTAQAMGPDYFDAESHPAAVFDARIEKLAEGYQASGDLTIRGETVPLTLPFTLDLSGGTARMSGSAEVNRMDFGIGSAVKDEATLGFTVTINIELDAARAQPPEA